MYVRGQDHGLPFMADERFTEDTLFLVAEEDWRCYWEDIKGADGVGFVDVNQDTLKDLEVPEDEDDMFKYREVKRARTSATDVSSQPQDSETHSEATWFCAEEKSPGCKYENDTSPELVDTVKLCTAAHRCRRGDLVWLGWNPADNPRKRKTAHGWGSQLMAVSAEGARKMRANFESWFEKIHWDFSVKDALEKYGVGHAGLRACYVRPAIGSFESHESGCTGVGERHAELRSKVVQEGTRIMYPGQRHRDIVEFSAKGEPIVLRQEVKIPEEVDQDDLRWFTYADKGMQEALIAELSARREVKYGLHWSEDQPAGVSTMPDEKRWMCEAIHHPEESKWIDTKSKRRNLRLAISNFEKRNFTYEREKAMVT